ncbi:MAG TPA: FHA domain-containing protein, partial [bacterium]|nr:FHA domain-containing protein [bacterium]
MPRLVYKDPSAREIVLGLRDKDVTIGRQADCDLVVTSASASRRHARVLRSGARWVLKDLGSSHGTQVNGNTIKGEHALVIGDRILLGDAEVVFEEGPAPVAKEKDAFPGRVPPTMPGVLISSLEGTSPLGLTTTKAKPAGAVTSAPAPVPRGTGEIIEATRVDQGELMQAMNRARKADIREKANTETGALLALVRISDELRQGADEESVCETTAR